MNQDDQGIDDRTRRPHPRLPTFTDTRATATTAIARTAQDIGLELSDADTRSLALAAVDAIERGIHARAVDLAHGLVDREVTDTRRHLIEPAIARAAADPSYAPVLRIHQEYLAGMDIIRQRLANVLHHAIEHWLGTDQPALQAQPVVPLPAPAGATEARNRVAAQVGAA